MPRTSCSIFLSRGRCDRAVSGVYSTRDFFGSELDGGIYFHSPIDYLAGLNDDRVLNAIRATGIFFCCGQGRWEERMLADTRRLEEVLRDKDIPAWVDYWGTDVDHDWPWWHKQLQYFMQRWLDDDSKGPAQLKCARGLFVQLRIVGIGKQPPVAFAALAVDRLIPHAPG